MLDIALDVEVDYSLTKVKCYCNKEYTYRKCYTNHIRTCEIYRIESNKPIPLVSPITEAKTLRALNDEAIAYLKSSYRMKPAIINTPTQTIIFGPVPPSCC